ncbi:MULTISPECIES: LysR substrate-binding domain-containing protein [unclassified Carboxylicivirga]|uniref:LysR substrate-binding domain-containing protein n=1 Tax=Carboxylicivirga TaxID=1628153 RepID=UPI003D3344D4
MNYRDIVFLTVAENLSFSKAAEALFISQPAVTRHIKELEGHYRVDLFERKGNKILLTKAGQMAYSQLKAIQQQYRELEFTLGSQGDVFRGQLRVGASSTISQYIIPRVMAAFHQKYPKIDLYLFNGNSFEMEQKLLGKEIDIALVENASSQSNIKYRRFMQDEIIAVASARRLYGHRKNISLAEFKDVPIVVRENGSGTLEVINKALKASQLSYDDLNIAMHLGSTEAIKNFVAHFDGVALLSDYSVAKELQHNELVRIAIKGFSIVRSLRIAQRQGHVSRACELFISFLEGYNLKL